MSSGDDKTDGTSQNKLDIEAFRHHLLNYRSKVDESESDITYQFDLDSSFKRMLDEKRQMTNKENNPPTMEPSTSNPPEKPLRKDLMKERIRSRIQDDSLMEQSSYVMEHSIGTDMEFATINRLLADFNINRDSSLVCSKRSPLKMLKITGDSLREGESYQLQRTEDISERTNVSHARVQALNDAAEGPSSANPDDTLEEIEYVLDRGLHYVPKRLINEIKTMELKEEFENEENIEKKENEENDENRENDENAYPNDRIHIRTVSNYETVVKCEDDDVIVLDSSPETSFITTQNTECYKSAFESIETTYHTAKTDLNNMSVLSISDSDSNSDEATVNQSENKKNEVLDQSELEPMNDDSFELSLSAHKRSTAVRDKYDDMPHFNDTLERVDYMMAQGQKMLSDKQNLARTPQAQHVHVQQMQNKKTPLSQKKTKILTPNSSSAKKAGAKHLTPNKIDMFKRPDQRTVRSPFAAKSASASKVQAAPITRIPMKTGSHHKPQFRHIASPIAAYIKNTPEVPLMKTIKPVRNLMAEEFNKVIAPRSHDESTQSVESFPIKSALPRKMYTSGLQRKIIDNRVVVTPGGKSIQKLIGTQPLVIRHDGKVKGHNQVRPKVGFEDSLADLSVASGDISVQVVQDVHRKN